MLEFFILYRILFGGLNLEMGDKLHIFNVNHIGEKGKSKFELTFAF